MLLETGETCRRRARVKPEGPAPMMAMEKGMVDLLLSTHTPFKKELVVYADFKA
jgi:hypothetical protein